MSDTSESLLAQILLVVQEVQVSMDRFNIRLNSTVQSLDALNIRVDNVISGGFPKGDYANHKKWHQDRQISAWKRFIINLLTR